MLNMESDKWYFDFKKKERKNSVKTPKWKLATHILLG